jgi:hypothetical protein
VKEKVIYLQGKVKGFFRQGDRYSTGVYTFSERILHVGDVYDANTIDEVDLEEHCVGQYFRSSRHHTLRFFVNEGEYIAERVKHFVIRDIVIDNKVTLENEQLIPFEGTILMKLVKPLPPPAPVKANSLLGSKLASFNGGAANSGCFGRSMSMLTAPLQGQQPLMLNTPTIGRGKELLSLFIGAILMTFILGSLLHFFGANSILSYLLPAVFFASIVLHGLFKHFPSLQNHLGIQRPLLNFFAWAMILGNLFGMIQHGPTFSSIHGLLLGIALFLLSRTGRFIRTLGWIFLVCQLLYYFTQVREALKVDHKKDDSEYVEPEDDDVVETEMDSTRVTTEDKDTVKLKYRIHNHQWKDNASWNYSGEFKVRDDYYNISRIKRNQLTINAESSMGYWRQVYRRLTNERLEFLDEVVNEYKRIIKKKQLNRSKAADMVVTSIQNIPYCLVHDLSHSEADRQYGGFITEWHQKGGPCLELIKFGLQSPTEFMGNFKGDCDTRSVMLYHVLSRLGYDVVVLASDQYGHAILGISGNYRGKYVNYNGLNYYVWETTYPGYEPGVISDECGNMRYWYVALGPKN